MLSTDVVQTTHYVAVPLLCSDSYENPHPSVHFLSWLPCTRGRRVFWSQSKLCCSEGIVTLWYSCDGQCKETVFLPLACALTDNPAPPSSWMWMCCFDCVGDHWYKENLWWQCRPSAGNKHCIKLCPVRKYRQSICGEEEKEKTLLASKLPS